jgi:hypothetical protein
VAQDFITAAQQRPEIGRITTTFSASTPNYQLEIDREKAKKLGVPISDVFTTLQTFLGGYQVNDFSRFGRNYKVTMQAESDFRQEVTDISRLFVRNKEGGMVPLDTLTTWQAGTGARFLQRYNLYRTASFSGSPAPGASSGDVINALQEVAAEVLPDGYGFEWSGQSKQEIEAGNSSTIVLSLSIIVVFLFLAALYESWAVPFAVLLATPFGFLGALFALKLTGTDFNVYGQIGLVTLVGLSAKNAILIVEFAKLNRERGMPIYEAALGSGTVAASTGTDDVPGLHPGRRTADDCVRCGRCVQAIGRHCRVRGHDRGNGADDARGTGLLRADPGPGRTIRWRVRRREGADASRRTCRSGGIRMIARLALLGVAALTVSGCAIGPDYERPQLPAPAEFRGVMTPQEAESFADLAWAEVFAEPELRSVIETALENNLDLQLAAARVEEFRARARVSRSYLGPDLRVVGNTAPSPGSSEDSSYSLGLSLNWELDLFGRLRRASEATQAQLLATEDFRRGVVNALIADVATTWFRLRELDEELAIVERTIRSQQESLELVRSLKRNGVASAAEEAQALAQLATTRAQLPLAEQRRVQTENLLRFLLGANLAASRAVSHPPRFRCHSSFPSACRPSCCRVGQTCGNWRTSCVPPLPLSAWPRRVAFLISRSG